MTQVPSAGEKKSGWGDSPGKGAGEKPAPVSRRRRQADKIAEDEDSQNTFPGTTQSIVHIDEDDADDGPASFIPDLENEEEQLGLKVVVAPTLNTSRVQTIAELDAEIDMALPSSNESGVDLSVLQAYLTPQEQVLEEDVPWDFEHELQTIASELQREREERAGNGLAVKDSPKKNPLTEISIT